MMVEANVHRTQGPQLRFRHVIGANGRIEGGNRHWRAYGLRALRHQPSQNTTTEFGSSPRDASTRPSDRYSCESIWS